MRKIVSSIAISGFVVSLLGAAGPAHAVTTTTTIKKGSTTVVTTTTTYVSPVTCTPARKMSKVGK